MSKDRFDHIFIAPSNFAATLKFFKNTLGWTVESEWGGDDSPQGAILKSDSDYSVVIAEYHDSPTDQAWHNGYLEHRPTLHLAVDDVDARYKALPDKSRVIIPPENTHWGTRWFVIRDPDNNLIAFNGPPKQV